MQRLLRQAFKPYGTRTEPLQLAARRALSRNFDQHRICRNFVCARRATAAAEIVGKARERLFDRLAQFWISIPAVLIALRHFSTSSLRKLPKASGVLATGMA